MKLVSGTFFRGFAARLVRASPERKVPDTHFAVASHTLPDSAGTVLPWISATWGCGYASAEKVEEIARGAAARVHRFIKLSRQIFGREVVYQDPVSP